MFLTKVIISIVCFLPMWHISVCQNAQDKVDDFEAHVFSSSSGIDMPYRLFVPEDYDATKSYPIIMYLHGGAGAGDDNIKQITGGNTNGTHVWIAPENQAKYPTFVVAPQLLGFNRWNDPDSVHLSKYGQIAIDLLKDLQQKYSIDPDRIYLTGQSRGGYGAWDIAGKYPDLFAAAVPLCGGGNLFTVKAMKDLPTWAFHGAQDSTVSVEKSRAIVAALQKVGGNIKYTEYPEMGHSVWNKAYVEPGLIEWLFVQRRKSNE